LHDFADKGEYNVPRGVIDKVMFAVLDLWLYRPYSEFETS